MSNFLKKCFHCALKIFKSLNIVAILDIYYPKNTDMVLLFRFYFLETYM